MTWNEYFDYLVSRGCGEDNASNVIAHQMDIYEDWEWEHEISFPVSENI